MRVRDDGQLERDIESLLANPELADHPLRAPLADLYARFTEQLTQLERLTSISDGFHSALREHNQSLTERYRRQIRQLHKIVVISDQYQGMLRDLNEALKVASTQDALTHLPNRRFMVERLQAETALCLRDSTPYSLVMADVDHFKRINDEAGHAAGDVVLVEIAQALSAELRGYDVCARWGGEEFLILLPHTPLELATEVSERLRRAVERITWHEHPAGWVTASFGVVEHERGSHYEETIRRADQAMYDAKSEGRNRIVRA